MYKVKPKLNTSFVRLCAPRLFSKSSANQWFEREWGQCWFYLLPSPLLFAAISYFRNFFSAFRKPCGSSLSSDRWSVHKACSHGCWVDNHRQHRRNARLTDKVRCHCPWALCRWFRCDRQSRSLWLFFAIPSSSWMEWQHLGQHQAWMSGSFAGDQLTVPPSVCDHAWTSSVFELQSCERNIVTQWKPCLIVWGRHGCLWRFVCGHMLLNEGRSKERHQSFILYIFETFRPAELFWRSSFGMIYSWSESEILTLCWDIYKPHSVKISDQNIIALLS